MKKPSVMTTLCYIEKENSYLMLHRVVKKNEVNKDTWIRVAGDFEEGESPEECLLREVKEETGLTLKTYDFRGLVTFKLTDSVTGNTLTEYMCLYTAAEYEGELSSCDEGVLEWVPKEKIQDLEIWEGDKIFFRLLNEGHPFFSLKLWYIDNELKEAVLNGRAMELRR